MLKRSFWLGYLLLVTLAAALGADMAKSYISAKLATPLSQEPVQTSNAPSQAGPEALAAYQIIATRNIFNATPPQNEPPPVQTPPPVDRSAMQETQLQLRLMGTVAGNNEQRYAIIADLSKRESQAMYQIGDAIAHALIVEIRPNCVVLDKGGQYESLCFQEDNGGGTATQSNASSSQATVKDTDDADILQVDAATWRLSREMILEQFGNLGGLSAQARMVPYMVQGQPQGFRLIRVTRGSLLEKIGLQRGDVMQKVNGLDINSPQEALQAFQQLQNASTVRLEILRRNRAATLTYELR